MGALLFFGRKTLVNIFCRFPQRGDDTASVPDDLPPDELDVTKALELLALPKSDEPIGEMDGYPVYAKNGRFGPYVQWGAPDDLNTFLAFA